MTARSRDAARLAHLLHQHLDRHVTIAWYPDRSVWSVEWCDGPGVEEMASLVGELAGPALDLQALRYDHSTGGSRAWAVQLVRHLRAGGELLALEPHTPGQSFARGSPTPAETAHLHFKLDHIDQPWADRPLDDEEEALAEALIRATRGDEFTMWNLLADGT